VLPPLILTFPSLLLCAQAVEFLAISSTGGGVMCVFVDVTVPNIETVNILCLAFVYWLV
jgi:hypothetical protein